MESQEYGRQEDKVEEADHSHLLEVTKKYSPCPNKRSSAPAVRGEQDPVLPPAKETRDILWHLRDSSSYCGSSSTASPWPLE